MSHGVFHEPHFDFESFRSSTAAWAAAGEKRLTIEWQTGPGPVVAWFPAGDRKLGKSWQFAASPTQYDEQYADYLEHDLMPRLIDLARDSALKTSVICVDQQPIQVMRMRRREIEHAQRASGLPAHIG